MVLCTLICLMSRDCKVLSAYSSVVHIGLFFLLFFSGSSLGASTSLLVLLGHGYVSALLFWVVGELYKNVGVRLVYHSGGLWTRSFAFLCVTLGVLFFNAGLPLSANFFAEVLGLSLLFRTRFYSLILLFIYYLLGLVYCIVFFVSLSTGAGSPVYPVGLVATVPLLLLSSVCFVILG